MKNKLTELIKLARPHQYVKNGFIFLPVFFGYGITDLNSIYLVILAFMSFSLAASSQYVLNDILDVNEDRNHPKKCKRPVAAGTINTKEAYFFFLILAFFSFLIGIYSLNVRFLICLISYIILNVSYSYYLKHIAIIDITCIAMSFVIRVLAGAAVINIFPSHWLIIMTFLLSLFIALAKRRDDLLMAQKGKNTRKCIENYNFEFISSSMMVMASVTIVSYILYTVSPEVTAKHGSNNIYLTTFFVIIGFLRYLQITFVLEKSGSPTKVVLKDLFLQSIILMWLLTFFSILYIV